MQASHDEERSKKRISATRALNNERLAREETDRSKGGADECLAAIERNGTRAMHV